MGRVHEVDVMRVVFALGVVLAAVAIVGATLERATERLLYAIVGGLGALATAGWILFALDPSTDLAYPAAGLTVCLLVGVGAIGIRRGIFHARKVEGEIARAEARLAAQGTKGADERAAGLGHGLA